MDRKAQLEKLKKRKAQGETPSPEQVLGGATITEVSGSGKNEVSETTPVVNEVQPKPVMAVEPPVKQEVVKPAAVEKPVIQVHEEPQLEVIVKPANASIELPARLKRNFLVDNDQGKEKTNLAIADDVVRQFNKLKTFAADKRVKTTTNGLASNILREWLLKNGDELEKAFGYRPYSQNQ